MSFSFYFFLKKNQCTKGTAKCALLYSYGVYYGLLNSMNSRKHWLERIHEINNGIFEDSLANQDTFWI